jgi:hypothetical protein
MFTHLSLNIPKNKCVEISVSLDKLGTTHLLFCVSDTLSTHFHTLTHFLSPHMDKETNALLGVTKLLKEEILGENEMVRNTLVAV